MIDGRIGRDATEGSTRQRPVVLVIGGGGHRPATLEAAGYTVEPVGGDELDRLPAGDVVVAAPGPGEPTAPAVVRDVRARYDGPLLVLLDRSDETQRVRVLEAGADDCVDGVGDRELVARLAALLRRVRRSAPVGLLVDGTAREATLDGRPLQLTRREFDLLELLASLPRRAWSREQLLDQVWPPDVERQGTATVTEHVRRLRDKLVAAGGARDGIETVRGVGYRVAQAAPLEASVSSSAATSSGFDIEERPGTSRSWARS